MPKIKNYGLIFSMIALIPINAWPSQTVQKMVKQQTATGYVAGWSK